MRHSATIFAMLSVLLSLVLVAAVPSPNFLEKRHTGKGTWFDVGLGACGEENINSDKIIALPTWLYAEGKHCNQRVKISMNWKTVSAIVRDECEGCQGYHIDMSPSLFKEFANLNVGVLKDVTWSFE